MGQSCGICGIFGLLLSNYDWLTPLVTEIRDAIEKLREDGQRQVDEVMDFAFEKEWKPKLIAAFKEHGINVPENCGLHDTGTEDDRPARCDTHGDDFVLGFGIITEPWYWHESLGVQRWDETFRKAAGFHTWVWQG